MTAKPERGLENLEPVHAGKNVLKKNKPSLGFYSQSQKNAKRIFACLAFTHDALDFLPVFESLQNTSEGSNLSQS